jgi:hypothetical protein
MPQKRISVEVCQRHKVKGREVIGADGSYVLRESPAAYEGILGHEKEGLRLENALFWDDDF